MGKAGRKCEVCGIRKQNSGMFLARFPTDLDRCRKWVKATGNVDLVNLPISKLHDNKFICGNHFPAQSFNENKSRLKRNAVPTLQINVELPDELLNNLVVEKQTPAPEPSTLVDDVLVDFDGGDPHTERTIPTPKRQCVDLETSTLNDVLVDSDAGDPHTERTIPTPKRQCVDLETTFHGAECGLRQLPKPETSALEDDVILVGFDGGDPHTERTIPTPKRQCVDLETTFQSVQFKSLKRQLQETETSASVDDVILVGFDGGDPHTERTMPTPKRQHVDLETTFQSVQCKSLKRQRQETETSASVDDVILVGFDAGDPHTERTIPTPKRQCVDLVTTFQSVQCGLRQRQKTETSASVDYVILVGFDAGEPHTERTIPTPKRQRVDLEINVGPSSAKAETNKVDNEKAGNVYLELMQLEQRALVPNMEPLQCTECREECAIGAGVVLRDCIHAFCRECISDVVRRCQEPHVSCPATGCPGVLQEREIRGVMSEKEYENWLARGLAAAEGDMRNAFHCRTRDCPGWAQCDPGVLWFPCPLCGHTNCVPCQAIHEGQTCEQHRAKLQEAANFKTLDTSQTEEETNVEASSAKAEPEKVYNENAGNVYLELMQLERRALVPNAEPFECAVCMDECAIGAGVVLRDCVHAFCRECISDVVRHCQEPHVSCPATGCPGVLQEREIRGVVSEKEHEKWLARGLAAAESGTRNAFHCRTRDCPGWALCDPGVLWFPCPVCNHTNCVPCQAIHEGQTCEQHRLKLQEAANSKTLDASQTDKGTRALLDTLIKKGKALHCPECSAIIMKDRGCDYVRCSACKTDICWVTRGRRWGPGGPGDVSGGCRCGVDRKLCHPSCRNCH